MTYEPKTWACGDTITADDLNHIEQGIAESGGGDAGYECTEIRTTVFNGSIATSDTGIGFSVGSFTPSQTIDGDTVAVTMNGTEYKLPKVDIGGGKYVYGEFQNDYFIFTTYPCGIGIQPSPPYNFLTATEGEYQVGIDSFAKDVATTSCFESAVKKAIGDSTFGALVINVTDESGNLTIDKEFQEVSDAILLKRQIFINDGAYKIHVSSSFRTSSMSGMYLHLQGIANAGDRTADTETLVFYWLLITPNNGEIGSISKEVKRATLTVTDN